MAGIYLHIPFCAKACYYCDFHFSTNRLHISKMVDAICRELESRKTYLNNETIQTIYYGGGTPSILAQEHIAQIQNTIFNTYHVKDDAEITFECNPDNLDETYLKDLYKAGINRLSIGIQSFDNEQLKKLNRAHSSAEAFQCISLAQKIGFSNITIDLIYGLPETDLSYWQSQVDHALKLNVNHISAYCLTFEDKTVFGNWLKKGKIQPLGDQQSLDQFKLLTEMLMANGYEHYEISNFALNNYISKHNSAYWLGETYLGIGPSAHSFNGHSRQWNISNNATYIKHINNNTPVFQHEELSSKDMFNEYILTRLRTKWGLEKKYLSEHFPDHYRTITPKMEHFTKSGQITEADRHFFLSETGKFIADYIASDLFVV